MSKSVIVTALALSCGIAFGAVADPVLLTGKSLAKAVSGRTIFIQTPIGEEVAVRYRSNGTMVGKSSAQLAFLAGESTKKDKGHWWVRSEQLCQQWRSWSKGRKYCYKLRVSGKRVRWSRNDGKTGTARLGR
ncbi:MAG: hypothetical protein P8Y47_06950 [Alphaproteobacteria bacterium]